MLAKPVSYYVAKRQKIIDALWVTVFVLGATYFLQDYIPWQSLNFVLGLAGLPLMNARQYARNSNRFGWVALALCATSFIVPAKTLLFFGFLAALIFVKERKHGRADMLTILCLILMSPLLQYATGVFSFPIRMELTEWAGWTLRMISIQATVTGNVILTNGNEYTVDPACMGLKMLLSSWICGLIVIAIMQRAKNKKLSGGWGFCIMAGILGLNIIANLVRILYACLFQYFGRCDNA